MNQPLWRRLLEPQVPLKRRYRRLLVVAFHGGYAALLIFWAAQLSAPASQAAYFALLACWLLIFMTTGFISDKWEEHLDERQRYVRNFAHRYAYLWLAGVAVIVYVTRDNANFTTLAMYVLLHYMVLPSSVIAWLEPDPIPEPPYERLPSGHRWVCNVWVAVFWSSRTTS